jgi:quercetin dioxygenase-like cupin family protein
MEIRDFHDSFRFSKEKMQKVKLFSSDDFFFDLYCLEPGQSQKVHTHDSSSKVYVVLEGTARIHVGGETNDVGAGRAVLAPRGAPHGVDNASDERVVLLVAVAPPPRHG